MCVCYESVRVRGWRQCWCRVRGMCGNGECIYEWYTWFRCFSSTGHVLGMSVVRAVGGVCVFGSRRCGWRGGEGLRELGLGLY